MSQGELHALAMALFLPRAITPGSPFRFVVLDDPIQAMDPAKVDGFVQVLARLAATRQVVVFSHDARLAQVVRDSEVDAEILEVRRHTNSSVEVTRSLDPATRAIEDAFALALDRNVPATIVARVVPGLCRAAVEAVALAIYRSRRLSAGDQRDDVETAWHEAVRMKTRIALALHGDKSADVSTWITKKPSRQRAIKVVVNRVHTGLIGDPIAAIRDVEEFVKDLRGVNGVG